MIKMEFIMSHLDEDLEKYGGDEVQEKFYDDGELVAKILMANELEDGSIHTIAVCSDEFVQRIEDMRILDNG